MDALNPKSIYLLYFFLFLEKYKRQVVTCSAAQGLAKFEFIEM